MHFVIISGVARLGHTGACSLATRGHAPPVQVCNRIIGADSVVVDHKLGATLAIHEFAVSDLHCTTVRPQNQPGWLSNSKHF